MTTHMVTRSGLKISERCRRDQANAAEPVRRSHFATTSRWIVGLVLAVGLAAGVQAGSVEPHDFDSPEQESAYKKLIAELRCLVCQNQNIADSNADLAKDLRRETYDMLKSGKGHDEVVDFMVARYGDFVLYRPPVKPTTWLLWGAPLLMAIIGLGILYGQIRGRSRAVAERDLSDDEKTRLQAIMSGDDQEQSPK